MSGEGTRRPTWDVDEVVRRAVRRAKLRRVTSLIVIPITDGVVEFVHEQ